MKLQLLFVITLCSYVCVAQEAKDLDGNHLLDNCTAAVQFMDSGKFDNDTQASQTSWCTGYVTGVLQGLDLARGLTDKEYRKVYPCLTGVAAKQAIRVIVKYLRDNPEKLQERGITLAFAALQRAFPCK
ncbi:MAG: hypothetical protein LAP86_29990 [Acidobacteriia bacterium]|nr:hypothetical protein [Terriglobia bacterium]